MSRNRAGAGIAIVLGVGALGIVAYLFLRRRGQAGTQSDQEVAQLGLANAVPDVLGESVASSVGLRGDQLIGVSLPDAAASAGLTAGELFRGAAADAIGKTISSILSAGTPISLPTGRSRDFEIGIVRTNLPTGAGKGVALVLERPPAAPSSAPRVPDPITGQVLPQDQLFRQSLRPVVTGTTISPGARSAIDRPAGTLSARSTGPQSNVGRGPDPIVIRSEAEKAAIQRERDEIRRQRLLSANYAPGTRN